MATGIHCTRLRSRRRCTRPFPARIYGSYRMGGMARSSAKWRDLSRAPRSPSSTASGRSRRGEPQNTALEPTARTERKKNHRRTMPYRESTMRRTLAAAGLLLFVANSLSAESRIEKNVVYGMYSGLALLMDVHHPAIPNGHAIVFVQGSGFSAALGFNAAPLKERPTVPDFAARLTASGHTVSAMNHRAVPRFQYPAAVEDVQRAVRFIRANAETYGIDPDHIGAAGGSSGGHLVSMLGTLDGKGDPEDL